RAPAEDGCRDLPQDPGDRAHRARGRPEYSGVVGHDGDEGRSGRVAVRRQRFRLAHDGRERRLGGEHDVPHDAERDAAADRRRRLHAEATQAGLHDSRGRRLVPDVLILVGSESDKPRIEPAFEILTKAGFSYEFYASSAHRQPEQTGDLVKNARKKGFKVIIAGAGLSAALPGFAASMTDLPVIGVPFAVGPLN